MSTLSIAFCELTSKDVVRHPLVQKIVQAYENYEEKLNNRSKNRPGKQENKNDSGNRK